LPEPGPGERSGPARRQAGERPASSPRHSGDRSGTARSAAGARLAATSDPARAAALEALLLVRGGAYANLADGQVLAQRGLSGVDAGFVTELVYGTCRRLGSLDRVIEAAAGRRLASLQPAVADVLRLGAYQLLWMDLPVPAAVSSSVNLAGQRIGARTTGVVNAILRRVARRDWDGWIDLVSQGLSEVEALAARTGHPSWIVQAYADLLAPGEVAEALAANNRPATPTLAVRPGLLTRDELAAEGGQPTPYSPWGVARPGNPADVAAVRDGLAGVQDEGSQLVAGLLASVDAPAGDWLDLCAGPGGKAALLTGLARQRGERLVAADVHPHRAQLVAQALRGFGRAPVVVADGRAPAWNAVFARVLVDAPCTGLGALRRRPEARWRKSEADLAGLVALQSALLAGAWASVVPGGVVAYVTCSPHPAETVAVVARLAERPDVEILNAPAYLPQVPNARCAADPRFVQLWPHRHHTDAMFAALLRRRP
jgi:16S rRNA (cytosine967-C5)-methyltransferase